MSREFETQHAHYEAMQEIDEARADLERADGLFRIQERTSDRLRVRVSSALAVMAVLCVPMTLYLVGFTLVGALISAALLVGAGLCGLHQVRAGRTRLEAQRERQLAAHRAAVGRSKEGGER